MNHPLVFPSGCRTHVRQGVFRHHPLPHSYDKARSAQCISDSLAKDLIELLNSGAEMNSSEGELKGMRGIANFYRLGRWAKSFAACGL